jgi:multidrug efflux pump subunit AcrA (membrane-fusion protein)
MKKKWFLWALVLLIPMAGRLMIPSMVESSIPVIYYTTPTVKTYENVVNCVGTIQSENVRTIYASGAVVPGEIAVSLGELVSEGQLLMTVDTQATEQLNQNPVSGALEELTGGQSSPVPDLAGLLSGYGLSDLLTGSLDIGELAGSMTESEATPAPSVPVLWDAANSEIIAPVQGMVTEIAAVPGSPVTAGKALFTVQDIKNYKVIATVGESDIAKIGVGDRAIIRGAGFSGTSFSGVVTMIHPTAYKKLAGTTTDTVVDVEIQLQNPNNRLKPGFSAKVEIRGEQTQELITVPYEAIRQDENNDEYVYVYENGKLKKARILTGKELTNEVEILSGLTTDSVVIYNPDDVQGEGAIVNIRGRAEGA